MQCLFDYLEAVDDARFRERRREDEDLPAFEPRRAGGVSASKHPFLEDELHHLVISGLKDRSGRRSERNTGIVTKYLGLDGSGGATLQEVGDQFGMTRERVRQISDRFIQRLDRVKTLPPRLQEVLSLVSKHLPSEADSLEKRLLQEGLTRTSFRLEGLLIVTKLLRQVPLFEMEDIKGRRMAIKPEKARKTKRIIILARKAIKRFGVATVTDVTAILHASAKFITMTTPLAVAPVLEALDGFEWLDKESGWFWFRGLPNNRVVRRIRKILSVTNRIHIGELRKGIARHHQMNSYAPSRIALLELCKKLPFCKVDGEFPRAEPGMDWRTVLRGTEFHLITVLKEHGPVMRRADFEQHCLALGMNRSTFYMSLEHSPVIDRLASDLYGIRGSRIGPGLLDSFVPHGQRRWATVQLEHGWTENGRIWIGYRLTAGSIRSGSFSIPGSMIHLVQGKHKLKTSDGVTIGTLVVEKNYGRGLAPFFRRRGGEPGDAFLLIIDAKAKIATISIGDERFLDHLQIDGTMDVKPP